MAAHKLTSLLCRVGRSVSALAGLFVQQLPSLFARTRCPKQRHSGSTYRTKHERHQDRARMSV
ncbi:uncharacterized protein METZ01_LOCUS227202 [marine metagenome]|uniref:Uncharacterized protein n=1 Tax=marine metagenome TaxID=408172 RepID=A0A382GGR5_9ZZZZ